MKDNALVGRIRAKAPIEMQIAGKLNDKLKGDVKILKKTKTLVFISCEISNDKEIVVSASGTWKIL